ncbi:MAG: GxxExxY protein [Verrucomicrobia bacterium]|nr:MAG: GxxExxY protein [Verrucomicrobiota bacterium]
MLQEPDERLDHLAHEVIGAAIEVHRVLGPGYLEQHYEEALCVELKVRQIPFERQKAIGVIYKEQTIGESRLDLLIADALIIELKAVEALAPIHTAQLISYLKMTGKKLGLLINFNVSVLKNGIRRIISS